MEGIEKTSVDILVRRMAYAEQKGNPRGCGGMELRLANASRVVGAIASVYADDDVVDCECDEYIKPSTGRILGYWCMREGIQWIAALKAWVAQFKA